MFDLLLPFFIGHHGLGGIDDAVLSILFSSECILSGKGSLQGIKGIHFRTVGWWAEAVGDSYKCRPKLVWGAAGLNHLDGFVLQLILKCEQVLKCLI